MYLSFDVLWKLKHQNLCFDVYNLRVAIVTDPLTESIGLCHGNVNIHGCL